MPVPNEIGLLSTRVDSYRQPIDTPSTLFRHPKILVLVPRCNRQKPKTAPLLSTRVDSYRHGSTWVNRSKKEILKGRFRQFFTPIRPEPANDLSKGKNPLWPHLGMGFAKPHPERRCDSSLSVKHYKILGYGLG